jgi:tripartite-type tricarboxylate transporter receptor subunit TctC
MLRSTAVALAAACGIIAGAPSGAQSYPSRPIRVTIPFGPSSAGDTIARAVSPNLSHAIKQTMVMDNRPGAGGNIAAEITANSAPDGYTLMLATIGTHAINASLYPRLPYDPVKDFTAIGLTATSPNTLVVNGSLPVKSVKDLIALAKAKPGELSFASTGVGTSVHLSGELFNSLAGLKTLHVPYKGAPEALTDVLTGRVHFLFASMSSSIGMVKTGKLRALAVTSAKRHPALPELPSMQEAGVPGFEAVAWYGFVGPAGLPRPVVKMLNDALVGALRDEEVKARLANFGCDPVSSTPEEFAAYIKSELAKWAKVVRESGAKLG